MKPYRDVFGNLLSKKDVTLAVQTAVMNETITTMKLSRSTGLGMLKSKKIIQLLEQAKVLSAPKDGTRRVIFNNEPAALNAALRQLKKGRK